MQSFANLVIRCCLLLVLLIGVAATTGCTPLVRERTLPPSIRNVYIPMVVNRTAEPAIEEDLTVALQEEFLADGRLNVTSEKDADAILRITLQDFSNPARGLDSDDFATSQSYDVEANILVEENIPGHPAIGGKRRVRSISTFNADQRTTTYITEPEVKRSLYRQMARQIVLETITGNFEEEASSDLETKPAPVEIKPAH